MDDDQGFFSNTLDTIGGLFSSAGDAVGDVVENIGEKILGPSGERGTTIGTAIGSAVYGPVGGLIGGQIGSGLSADIAAAPERIRQRQLTEDDVSGSVGQNDYDALQNFRDQYDYAQQRPQVFEGTVLDVRYPRTAGFPDIRTNPRDIAIGTAIGAGMDFIEQITDYFAGGDQQMIQQNMMCQPASRRIYSINQQTGLKELVRNVGIEIAAKQIGLPVSMLTQLLLKTFRTRRRGISGADLRTVRRVDRQMHSLACALGGISTTSRAVAQRKSPPKRSC
jgi:hypothetical protein